MLLLLTGEKKNSQMCFVIMRSMGYSQVRCPPFRETKPFFSLSYRDDLIRVSPLSSLLTRYPRPFGNLIARVTWLALTYFFKTAMLNGIRLEERLALLKKTAVDHDTA